MRPGPAVYELTLPRPMGARAWRTRSGARRLVSVLALAGIYAAVGRIGLAVERTELGQRIADPWG